MLNSDNNKSSQVSDGPKIVSEKNMQHLILDDTRSARKGTTIEHGEFSESSTLETFQVLPNSNIICIGACAFRGCELLRSASFSENVTTIGNCAFWGCKALQSVHIPKSIVTIECGAFWNCTSLQDIDIPNGVTTIGINAFYGCKSLKTIRIPDGVRTIGWNTFSGCNSLQSVYIPDSVTVIGDHAFCACTSLWLINLPHTVSSIGDGAFVHCKTLNQRLNSGLNYHANIPSWLRQRFSDLPIHQACYHYVNDSSSAMGNIHTLIQENRQVLTATDAMGMTALHIICCNPTVSVETIQHIVQKEPSVLTHVDVTGSSPLHLFLKFRGLLTEANEQESIPLLPRLLERGIKYNDLTIFFALYSNHLEADLIFPDESTGLLPFMSAATLSCGLDVVYALAMRKIDIILENC